MFKSIIIFILFNFLTSFGFSHDSNKAFFKINQEVKYFEIEAEFPWSIRNALLEFNPELENATSKQEFIASLKRYIAKHLILSSKSGNQFELMQLKEITNTGHSHQSNYSIIYKGEDLKTITNKLLFNINQDQQNYHQLNNDDNEVKFTTFKNQPTFNLPNTQISNYWYLSLTIPIGIFLFIWRRGTKN